MTLLTHRQVRAALCVTFAAASASVAGWWLGQGIQFFALAFSAVNLVIPLVLIALAAANGVVVWYALRKPVRLHVLSSWFAVPLAASYLVTSTWWELSLEPDLRGQRVGVYARADEARLWRIDSEAQRPRIDIDETGAVTLSAGSGLYNSTQEVIWDLPDLGESTLPDTCRREQAGRTLVSCPSWRRLRLQDYVQSTPSGPAHETMSIRVVDNVGDASLVAPGRLGPTLAPEVTMSTLPPAGRVRRFERVVAGQATVVADAVAFDGGDQHGSEWTAAIDYSYPSGEALLSTARDFSLVVLGGSVSWLLIPTRPGSRSTPREEPRRAAAPRRRVRPRRPTIPRSRLLRP